MIISASRRTDIPKYYAEWFINRIRAGYCTVANPYNHQQVMRIPLSPGVVDAIVFWTRDPRPLMPYLPELDAHNFRYYFQFTVVGYPPVFDRYVPPETYQIDTFKALANKIGPEKVVWRYDPMIFSNITDADYHRARYAQLASALAGYTHRSVISLLDFYAKTFRRMAPLQNAGVVTELNPERDEARFGELMRFIAQTAKGYNMQIESCAEPIDLTQCGIRPGKCVDDDLIERVFGISISHRKDPNQRETCGCILSRDIGAYDTCLHGCEYCYATSSQVLAIRNHRSHNPHSPSLVGWYEAPQEEVLGAATPSSQAVLFEETNIPFLSGGPIHSGGKTRSEK